MQAYSDAVVKYHAKYLVADEGPAIVASCNFTRKCFERTCDAIVVTYDPDVASGLRALMDVIPLDPTLVRGSHGRTIDDAADGPLLISSEPRLLADAPVKATAVKDLILAHVFA